MIKNVITYKNKPILTIYHRGFSKDCTTIKRHIKEYMGRNLLCFYEEYVADDEWNNLTGYVWEEKALITPKEKHNPYCQKACANMIHRIYPDKPSVIWKKNGTTIDEKELEQILAFVKKYTGMNLEEHLVYLGDVFLFSPSWFKYHSDKNKSIIIYHMKEGMRIILQLKHGHDVLEAKVIDITEDTEELEIATECDWNNHDIEIYENDELIYINREVYYVRYMNLDISVAARSKRIPLTTLREYYELKPQGETEKCAIGGPPEPVRQLLDKMNQTLVRKVNNQKKSDRFLFVRPGELDIAIKRITEVMFRATEELWIIDSYFTDKGSGLNQMTDWIRLITSAKATKKNIIFYCNNEDKALNAAQLKDHILRDPIVQDEMVENSSQQINLHQTKTAIHDRFLIIRNDDTYSGLSIGTSFNSLNSNHYCIQTLTHREVLEVLEALALWLENNVIAQEEC